MARRNMHGKVGVKFKAGFTASKQKNMMRNLTSELIKYGALKLRKSRADLKVSADKMVTLAKKAISIPVVLLLVMFVISM